MKESRIGPAAALPVVTRAVDELSTHPGIYVGAWRIPPLGGFARHTALLLSPPMEVVELVVSLRFRRSGPAPRTPAHNIITRGTTPHYGALAEYRWVQVAGTDASQRVSDAIDEIGKRFQGRWYLFSSNRFIGEVLRHAGVVLGDAERVTIGRAPGLDRAVRQ